MVSLTHWDFQYVVQGGSRIAFSNFQLFTNFFRTWSKNDLTLLEWTVSTNLPVPRNLTKSSLNLPNQHKHLIGQKR